jgi:arylsulfatase A-like enzyme
MDRSAQEKDESGREQSGLTRKQLLGSGASAAAAALLAQGAGVEQALAAGKGKGKDVAGMNVLLFLTDQERAIQHFPPDWVRKNLPGMRRLKRHGLSFERAFTNSCMCSPARSTLMSGVFPAQHGVKYTLEEDMVHPKKNPQVDLPTDLKNLATVMKAAGYHCVYKGKWHCSKPAEPEHAVPADLEKYGFDRWNPPDAGANQDLSEAGGGTVNNDGRFMEEVGEAEAGKEGALQYLKSVAPGQQPFFMVISLVNPHDVLFYPGEKFSEDGYDQSWLEGDIGLPATVAEDLADKPSVQAEFVRIFNLTGKPKSKAEKIAYLNFYGNLMKSSDAYLVEVLDALEEQGLLDETLIVRTADHGEMGLAHGGMRQKNFNFYEEALRVPLVYSNPALFPKPVSTDALVSHVDFLPTLASLAKAPPSARSKKWQGVDYASLVLRPSPSRSTQDYVVFTYDDYQSGQKNPPYPKPPNHIVSIREERWKLAKYYDADGEVPPQWEMYDLKRDPLERENIAHHGFKRTPKQEEELQRLKRKLKAVEQTRLQPLR